jgi:Na+/H+ antiporter NhaD/arsenite permease-like protein
MLSALVIIFVVTYLAITLEHPIKINKSATALLGAGLLWTVYALATNDHLLVKHQLSETIASTAEIVFFLIGAMTIVEVIDAHDGFDVVTSRIKTKNLSNVLSQNPFKKFTMTNYATTEYISLKLACLFYKIGISFLNYQLSFSTFFFS